MRCRNFISFDTFECLALEIYELTESISQPTLSNQQETDYWLEALSVYLLGSALQISSHKNWNALLALTCLSYLLVIQKAICDHISNEWAAGAGGTGDAAGWISSIFIILSVILFCLEWFRCHLETFTNVPSRVGRWVWDQDVSGDFLCVSHCGGLLRSRILSHGLNKCMRIHFGEKVISILLAIGCEKSPHNSFEVIMKQGNVIVIDSTQRMHKLQRRRENLDWHVEWMPNGVYKQASSIAYLW